MARSCCHASQMNTCGQLGPAKVYFGILLLLSSSGAACPRASAQEYRREQLQTYILCRDKLSHDERYDLTKKLALGWKGMLEVRQASARDQQPYADLVEEFNRKRYGGWTKAGVLAISLEALVRFNNLSKQSNAYACLVALVGQAIKQPWSSVHTAFVEYLPQQQKNFFMSLPER